MRIIIMALLAFMAGAALAVGQTSAQPAPAPSATDSLEASAGAPVPAAPLGGIDCTRGVACPILAPREPTRPLAPDPRDDQPAPALPDPPPAK